MLLMLTATLVRVLHQKDARMATTPLCSAIISGAMRLHGSVFKTGMHSLANYPPERSSGDITDP